MFGGLILGGSKYLLFGGVKGITNHSLLRGLLTHGDPWFLTTYLPSWDPDPPRISPHIKGIDGFSDSFCISLCRYSSASDAILIFDASDRLWSLPMKQARAQDALTRGQGTKGNGTIGMAPLRSVFGDLGRGWELSFDRLSWNEFIMMLLTKNIILNYCTYYFNYPIDQCLFYFEPILRM